MRRSHRNVAAAVAAACVALVWIPSGSASPAIPPWVHDAVERLKTLGVMPLWIGTVRPVSYDDLQAALLLAAQQAETVHLPAADRGLLDQLSRQVGISAVHRNSTFAAVRATALGLTRVDAALASTRGGTGWMSGWAADSYRAALLGATGSLAWLAGREHLGWGPTGEGALLFSDAGGGFDHIQLSFPWGRLRFAKVIGWADDGRSVVATRVDVPYRRNVRFGFAEAVLMQGAPYAGYVLVPLPVGFTPYLQQQFREPYGFNDNYLLTVDLDWVVRPGLRLFGELLVDDYTVPTPTANFPSRWGLTVGLHSAPAHGSELHAQYTIVPNWTYSSTDPALHYLLRGLPLGHPLGTDFDVLHIRWTQPPHPSPRGTSSIPSPLGGEGEGEGDWSFGRFSLWLSYVRKGEGEVGRIWTDETEAWQYLFLRGVVEYSLIAGVEIPVTAGGWTGSVGPWLAFRTNADHVQDATRIDVGLSVALTRSFE